MTRLQSFLFALCVGAGLTPAQAQSFHGVKIGADSMAVAGFGGPVALGSNGPDRYAKFRMPDGHELSVTTRSLGPIIYMENNRDPVVPPTAGVGMRFGITTRDALVALVGNPGFVYATRTRVPYSGGTTLFHSYELNNQPGVVVSFAFHLAAPRAALGDGAALLDSIIVAQAWYLDEIWGPTKTAYPGYSPLTLHY